MGFYSCYVTFDHEAVISNLAILNRFRFKDENEYEYEILIKVFARVLKKTHPEKFHFTFFHQKFSTVIYTEGD